MVYTINKVAILLGFCLLCVCLCACSNIKQPQCYTEKVHKETVINGLLIEEHSITVEYQNKERMHNQAYLNALIKFPQISDMNENIAQDKTNRLLKHVAFESISHTDINETLKLFNGIVHGSLSKEVWSGENEYKIIYIGNKNISLNYTGDSFFGGAYPSHFSNYVTISLSNGKLISFTDYFSKDTLVESITSKKFEWIEGQYTGGYKGNEPEVISEFVKALKQLSNLDTESNISDSSSAIYNSASTYNFAMDEQFVYIGIPFNDSLDGYITLKFNRNDLN